VEASCVCLLHDAPSTICLLACLLASAVLMQAFVDQLDKRYVKVVGFMTHLMWSSALWPLFDVAALLQAFVDQLDKRYVRVVGFMMHLNGYPDEQKAPLSQQFLQVRNMFCFA
jgi:hypothetical protein